MDPTSVLRQRLSTQHLSSAPLSRAADAVRLLTCVQAQERDHAFFSLALRSRSSTYAAVQAEYDGGAFLRTHLLRPTWHFVRPEDLRWILAATSGRVVRGLAGRHRQVGLGDPHTVARALDAVTDVVAGRAFPTRQEIGAALDRRGGLPAQGVQLGHLLLLAELQGLICSGPLRGPHHTYALVDEVVPPGPALDRPEALARLAHRFLAGHGPASASDFARWATLTAADARAAIAEARSGPGTGDGGLEQVDVGGVPHWFDPAARARARAGRAAYLLPVYDEAVHACPAVGFPPAQGHPTGGRVDPFWGTVVVDTVNAGVWRRRLGRGTVAVETRLAPTVDDEQRALVGAAARRLACFVGRELDDEQAPSG